MFLAIAALFAFGVRELPIGTAFRMGPGYFPLVLVMLLTVFGLVILIRGIRVPGAPIGAIPWRGIALITLPVIFFGATLKGLGSFPRFRSPSSSRACKPACGTSRPRSLITAVLVVFDWVVFVKGLGLPISLYGAWVGGY